MGFTNIHEHVFASGEKWWMMDSERGKNVRLSHYSTNIAAAWQVVEKMSKEEMLDFAIRICNYETIRYEVSWQIEDGEDWKFCMADTAPLAVCRAALIATMEETK